MKIEILKCSKGYIMICEKEVYAFSCSLDVSEKLNEIAAKFEKSDSKKLKTNNSWALNYLKENCKDDLDKWIDTNFVEA